jgi:hypothetical protein
MESIEKLMYKLGMLFAQRKRVAVDTFDAGIVYVKRRHTGREEGMNEDVGRNVAHVERNGEHDAVAVTACVHERPLLFENDAMMLLPVVTIAHVL